MQQFKQTLTPDQIIENHIKNNGVESTLDETRAAIKATLRENPNASLVRVGDCLYLINIDGKEGLFYIINGGGGLSYLKATREFIQKCREKGLKVLKMYVSDKDTAEQLAQMVGAQKVSFELDESREQDPYLMTMEI